MAGEMFLQYPLHKSKISKLVKFRSSLSLKPHGLVFLLIVLAALLGSSVLRSSIGGDRQSATEQHPSSMLAFSLGSATADAKVSTTARESQDRKHLLKDGAIVAVCLLAASLWWLVRSPSGREQSSSANSGSARPLVVLGNPWNADEQERKQISRDLHDCVGQVLTAAGMELSSVRSSDLSKQQLSERLESVSQLNAEALRLVKDLAIGLRPAMLDDIGLADALRWQVRQFSRRSGILGSIEIWGGIDQLPEAQTTCIYRCLQEALTNCARHSRARKLEVLISATENLVTFVVEDDGIGLKSESAASPGLGVLGMHERVESLGGRLKIDSHPDKGTRLMFEIPVTVEAHA